MRISKGLGRACDDIVCCHRLPALFQSKTKSILLASIAAACLTSPLSAQAVRDFGALPNLLNNDDDVSLQNLGFSITIGSQTTSTVGSNTNGTLTFDGTYSGFGNSDAGLLNYGSAIIAPFWEDLNPGAAGNFTFGQVTLNSRNAFTALWTNVPRFNNNGASTFQVIVIDRSDRNPGDFDVEFNYDVVNFLNLENGTVGLSEGSANPANTVFLTGSTGSQLEDGEANALVDGSNVGLNGRYLFRIINGQIFLATLNISSLLQGATPNQASVAEYLDALGSGSADPDVLNLITTLAGLSGGDLLNALDRLQPEHYLSQVNDTLHSSLFFLNSVMSCPTANGTAEEGECYWAKVGGRSLDWDRTRTNIGGDIEAWNVSGGIQVALDPTWRLGAALSFEDVNAATNNSARSDGERVEGAIVLKNSWGNTSFAAAAFGGYGWFDTERTIALPGTGTAKGDHDIAFGGVHARLSHTIQQPGWYAKPMVDLNATYIDFGGFSESGAGIANLAVAGEHDWVFSVGPAIELGADYRHENGTVYRPFVRIGATIFDDASFSLTSSFSAVTADASPFTIQSKFDDVFLDVSAGVDVISTDGFTAKLNYDGRFSEHTDSHGGGVKVGFLF